MDQDRTTPTTPDVATRAAERDEAEAAHEADRMPTPDEEREAEETELDPQTAARVAEHEREMAERGAHQEGEGRLP